MKSEKKERINIVFVCDNDYALPTGVAISSLFERRDRSRDYLVTILASGLSAAYSDALSGICADGFSVRVTDAPW